MRPTHQLPISERSIPAEPAWLEETSYLMESGSQSLKTETTYRSSLHLFADWVQSFAVNGYSLEQPWPLDPKQLTNVAVLNFGKWLTANRAVRTVTTYMAAVIGYLNYLESRELLPEGIQLGKLQRQRRQRRRRGNMAESVVNLDLARQAMPQIVAYYEGLPLPARDNDPYQRRLSILRDRALVQTLYSTAARLSEVVALNRVQVNHGRATHATIIGKGNKARTLQFRPYAQQALQAYLAERDDNNPALFVAHSRNAQNARLTKTSVHNVVKKAVKVLKLDPSLSAHDFRHFRATQLLREGMPLEVVQEFLGHVDIATTRNIYAPVLGVHIVAEWLENMDIAPSQVVTESEE